MSITLRNNKIRSERAGVVLRRWIGAHGFNWLSFAGHINDLRLANNLRPVSIKTVENWLYNPDRNIPAWVEGYLPLIEARLANHDASIIYQIPIALSEEENQTLIATAEPTAISVEDFLLICARTGFECMQEKNGEF